MQRLPEMHQKISIRDLFAKIDSSQAPTEFRSYFCGERQAEDRNPRVESSQYYHGGFYFGGQEDFYDGERNHEGRTEYFAEIYTRLQSCLRQHEEESATHSSAPHESSRYDRTVVANGGRVRFYFSHLDRGRAQRTATFWIVVEFGWNCEDCPCRLIRYRGNYYVTRVTH